MLGAAFLVILVMMLVRGTKHLRRFLDGEERWSREHFALVLISLGCAFVPAIVGVLFAFVFVGAGASVAQLSSSRMLWSFWFNVWPTLLVCTLAAFLAASLAFFASCRRGDHPNSYAFRAQVLLCFPVCGLLLLGSIPGA